METQIASYTVRDVSPPIINNQLSSISTSNVYVILSFSENIYTNSNGTGAVEASDFTLQFEQNEGTASAVEISNLQLPGPSGPLIGGEDSIWVYLNITGTPSGVETFTIRTNGTVSYTHLTLPTNREV